MITTLMIVIVIGLSGLASMTLFPPGNVRKQITVVLIWFLAGFIVRAMLG